MGCTEVNKYFIGTALKNNALIIQKELLCFCLFAYFACFLNIYYSLEMTLMLAKVEGKKRREWQRMRWSDSISDSIDINLSKLWETVKEGQGSLACCSPWGHKESDLTQWLNNNSNNHLFMALACGILVPHPGIRHALLALEGKVLTTGPPTKSEKELFWTDSFCLHGENTS